MDTPTLVGTGFVVLGSGRLDRLRRLRLPERPEASAAMPGCGRSSAVIFGPLGLMLLFVLPKQRAGAAGPAHSAKKKSEQEELYEVPKKHH